MQQVGGLSMSKDFLHICVHAYVCVCVCLCVCLFVGMSTVSLCSAVRAPQPSAAES